MPPTMRRHQSRRLRRSLAHHARLRWRQGALELVPVHAAHVRADVQVAFADGGRDLDDVEVMAAARDEAGPVARAHERLLPLAQAVVRHQRLGVAREPLAHGRVLEVEREPVEPVRALQISPVNRYALGASRRQIDVVGHAMPVSALLAERARVVRVPRRSGECAAPGSATGRRRRARTASTKSATRIGIAGASGAVPFWPNVMHTHVPRARVALSMSSLNPEYMCRDVRGLAAVRLRNTCSSSALPFVSTRLRACSTRRRRRARAARRPRRGRGGSRTPCSDPRARPGSCSRSRSSSGSRHAPSSCSSTIDRVLLRAEAVDCHFDRARPRFGSSRGESTCDSAPALKAVPSETTSPGYSVWNWLMKLTTSATL